MKNKLILAIAVIFFAAALPSFADTLHPANFDPHNVPPPSGAILDLAGTPILSGYNLYSVSFTAAASTTSTDVTFLFRNDPGYTAFDDASIVDVTNPSGNLFMNPGFESGSLTPGWTYDNVYGAPFGGVVAGGANPSSPTCMNNFAPNAGRYFWCDGATQAYDAIDQIVATTAGDSYTISFYQSQFDTNDVAESMYQQLSNNGCVDTSSCLGGTDGNGIDTLVYVGQTIPGPVPEPATISLFITGLIGVGVKGFKRLKR
jgi:hypothetical protein